MENENSTKNNNHSTMNGFAQKVAKEYDADVYQYCGSINDSGYGQITKAISAVSECGKLRDNALLILTTNGGSANAAYQIARLFQKTYKQFLVSTPAYCKSAGTLIALGATRLIMDAFSELGPLDVQLIKQNEFMQRKSGLLSKSSFESLQDIAFDLYEHFMLKITWSSGGQISFKLASELSASMASNLLAPVYAQMNPDVVGSDHRDLNIAMQYGHRLIENSRNASMKTVWRLVQSYPSHDFIIDNEEAGELFKNVDYPKESLYRLLQCLGDSAYAETDPVLAQPLFPISQPEDIADETEPDSTEERGLPAGRGAKEPVDAGGAGDRRSSGESAGKDGEGALPAGVSPSAEPISIAGADSSSRSRARRPKSVSRQQRAS